MREDQQEALQAMFPKGYVIMRIQPNGDPAYSWYNPLDDEFLVNFLEALHTMFDENNGNWDMEDKGYEYPMD